MKIPKLMFLIIVLLGSIKSASTWGAVHSAGGHGDGSNSYTVGGQHTGGSQVNGGQPYASGIKIARRGGRGGARGGGRSFGGGRGFSGSRGFSGNRGFRGSSRGFSRGYRGFGRGYRGFGRGYYGRGYYGRRFWPYYGFGWGLGLGYGFGGYWPYYGYGGYWPYYGGYYSPYYGGYGGYPPVVYIQKNDDAQVDTESQTNYWHYCRNPEGYYPYVKKCPDGWLPVAPQPTESTAPTTQ